MHFSNPAKILILSIAVCGFSILNLKSSAAEPEAEGSAVKIVLFPFREAILSSMVETAVRSHKFKEGERFKAGDMLIDLNDDTFKERLIKAKSACIESKAGVAFADKNLSRTRDLHKRGLQGLQDVERCELELDIANSKQTFQDANLKLAEQDLASCHIATPFAGRLVKKLLQEHEFVKVGQALIQIIDDNQLLAVMHLPSSERNLVKIGESQKVRVDETGTAHSGTVYEIGGEIDYGSRTFEIKLLIDNRDGALSAGMSGHLLSSDKDLNKDASAGK
ncbi:MAG: efflux RND transporter periplasmic adaptor subunit [Victivallales bacterium]|jgi:RND family efflux transporter MFP subunit